MCCIQACFAAGGAWSGGGSAPGGCLVLGGSALGGCLVETPQTATAAGGTHPMECILVLVILLTILYEIFIFMAIKIECSCFHWYVGKTQCKLYLEFNNIV